MHRTIAERGISLADRDGNRIEARVVGTVLQQRRLRASGRVRESSKDHGDDEVALAAWWRAIYDHLKECMPIIDPMPRFTEVDDDLARLLVGPAAADEDEALELLARGAHPQGPLNRSYAHIAAEHDQRRLLAELVRVGADIDVLASGLTGAWCLQTPLTSGALLEAERIEYLVALGADPTFNLNLVLDAALRELGRRDEKPETLCEMAVRHYQTAIHTLSQLGGRSEAKLEQYEKRTRAWR